MNIMKALRYLLIVAMISMASVLSAANAAAQNLATRPEMQMQSTSVMQGSGSTLPNAAVDGPYTTYDRYTPEGSSKGPRRAKKEDDGRPGDWTDPYKDPLGDAMIPLALLAVAYALARVYRRKRA
jgi:hypothetical protein